MLSYLKTKRTERFRDIDRTEKDKEREYLEVLTQDFSVVYDVNLSKNQSKLIKIDEQYWDNDRISLYQYYDYSERVEIYNKKYVSPGYQEEFRNVLRPRNLMEKLKETHRFTYRYQTLQKGESRYYEVNVFRMNEQLYDENVIIAFRDVEDIVSAERYHQKQLEERLEHERRQNEVLSALGKNYHAIFIINLLTDTYSEISCRDELRGFYNDKEASASKVLQEICDQVIAKQDVERMHCFFNLTTVSKRLERRESVETECITREGSWHRAKLLVKHRDEKGVVTHVLYVTQIIDDEKRYEERLIARAYDADLANQAKTDFISKVAHDIRTPMNSIFGFLKIAEANLEDLEKVQYSLEKIRVSSEFLKQLMNDVLDISHMEKGKLKLQPQCIKLSELLDEISVFVENTKMDKKQQFDLKIHDIRYPWIKADPLRLKQIYVNVLSNAIKYTTDGGMIQLEIYQEPSKKDGCICLVAAVVDNGIGMHEDFMKKMFDKFERATDTRVNAVSGYGLGLSIVKQLVEMMDGSLDVNSKLGEGTTVCIKLDVPYSKEPLLDDSLSQMEDSAMCFGMHLLVAEDNELNREVMTELLNMYGLSCECVEDGSVCLERFRNSDTQTYDAILMDMQMPKLNGIETTKRIRELPLPHAKTIPIIAMTANALKEDVLECLDAGMDKHLAKPVDMEVLLKALAETKRWKRMR